MITSITYGWLLYDEARGITEIDDELKEIYDDIIDDPKSIYRLFYNKNNQDKAKRIVDTFLDYFGNEKYIRTTIMLNILIEDGKLPKVLKMNPFECFSYLYTYEMDEMTGSEIAIQNFMDAYDYVLNHDFDEELDADDRKDLLLQKVAEYYNHDIAAIDKAISYIFSNVFENLHLQAIDQQGQDWLELIQDNAETLDQFISAFKNDTDFFWPMIDYFYSFNYYLEPDDLALLRYDFKTGNGDMKVLKKLNPFLEEESEAFSISAFPAEE